jgi:glycosyltransferase involved in cell wall biosynthesis
VTFVGRRPVREAFAATNTIVVPSRAESLPYIVIESIAAGKQVIATDVGGVAEIFGPTRDALVPADNVDALAAAMRETLKPRSQASIDTQETRYAYLAENFHVDTMVDQIAESYRAITAAR